MRGWWRVSPAWRVRWPHWRRKKQRVAPRLRQPECVSRALADAGLLTGNRIAVEVQGGEVVLSGTVETLQDRELTEETARAVDGVSRVENRLSIA
jgi:osmotically-inducible protein OsmY